MDSFLNQLIQAEQQGEAEAFASQRNVELVDGKVRVEIGAAPGQLDAVANAVAKFGNVEIVSRRLNGLQALVSVASLTALAGEESILYIKQPVASVPG